MKFITLIILLCAFNINAQMNEIYVSPTGSDNNIGSETSPFKTIERGIYELVRYGGPEPGATVFLIKGANQENTFYYENLTISNNDIIIKAKYPLQNITITKNPFYVGMNEKLVRISGQRITLDGIIFKNIHHGWPIYIEGDNNTIKNCKILGSQRDGISIIKSNNNLIYNNYIAMDTMIARIFPANAITIEGIWDNSLFKPANNNIIQQNHIVSSTSHHGINVMNTYLSSPPENKDNLMNYGNIIRDNFVNRCQAGIYLRKQKDFQIFNNIICRSYSTHEDLTINESDEGHAIKLAYDGSADSYSFMANGKIYNNLFYNYLNCGIYSQSSKQLYIYNNVFVKNMTIGDGTNG